MSEALPPERRPVKYQLPTDPALARAVRERAKTRLAEALDAVLAPAGYARHKPKAIWIRQGRRAKTYVEIQSSSYGFECFINLGQEKLLTQKIPSYANGTFWRLGKVAPEASAMLNFDHGDSLPYMALEKDPGLAPAVAELVRAKALPFLLRFHDEPDQDVKSGRPQGLLGRMLGWLSN